MVDVLVRLIIGVGNPMYGDDAAGYCAARALLECGARGARVVALPTLTISDAALLEGAELVVFIDAHPGGRHVEVYDLEVEEPGAPDPWGPDSHSVSPLDLVRVAHDAGILRGRVLLVLVGAPRIEFGQGLSGEAARRAVEAALIASRLAGASPPDPGCVASFIEGCRGEPMLD